MFQLPILAETNSTTGVVSETTVSEAVDYCWAQITGLSWFEAVIAIAFGAILLFHGWRIYKTLVVVSFAILGLFIGMAVGIKAGSPIWGAIVGILVLGFISLPLMQWAISILGAMAGGVLAAGFWYAVSLPENYVWAGALIGIVAGGMISFIVIKAAVVLFTSLQGAMLISAGALALLAEWSQTGAGTREIFFEQKWFFPALLAFITAAGMYIQMKFNKGDAIGGKK
jgi:hypothetical protein